MAKRKEGKGKEGGPSELQDLCDAVRKTIGVVINNDEEDRAAGKRASDLANSGLLIGKPRQAIERMLGPGTQCGKYASGDSYTFQSFGFARDDIYYSVGRLPDGWVGGVPNLVLGFDKDGKCSNVKVIHTQ